VQRHLELVEGPANHGGDLIELLGPDLELPMGLFEAESVPPGCTTVYWKGPPETSQAHSVRMNFRPGRRPRLLVCHARSWGFCDCWPTIGLWIRASLNFSTTVAMANAPPSRS
jgi:hypothetical protein